MGIGILEDDAAQLLRDLLFALSAEGRHERQINLRALTNGEGKRFAGGVHLLNRFRFLNRALREDVRFALQLAILIQHLKRRKQAVAAVLLKGSPVGLGVDQSIFTGKGIIQRIEPLLHCLDLGIGSILELSVQELANAVAQAYHRHDAASRVPGQVNRIHDGVFPVIDAAFHGGIAEIAHIGISGQ